MRRYTPETRVVVHPFVQQTEGEEVVIGQPEAQIFLVLPPDAVEILEYLQ
jgi:putative peptide zinc metalloprotease protein